MEGKKLQKKLFYILILGVLIQCPLIVKIILADPG